MDLSSDPAVVRRVFVSLDPAEEHEEAQALPRLKVAKELIF
jgi:hypothetical protein